MYNPSSYSLPPFLLDREKYDVLGNFATNPRMTSARGYNSALCFSGVKQSKDTS